MKLKFILLLLICFRATGQPPKEKNSDAHLDSLLNGNKHKEALSYAFKEYHTHKTPLSKAKLLFVEFKIEQNKNRLKEASSKINEAITLLKNGSHLKAGERNYLIDLYRNYAGFLSEAELQDEALAKMKECYENSGFRNGGEKERALFLYSYAKLNEDLRNTFEAIAIYEEALPVATRAFGEVSNEVALIYNDFAVTCFTAYLSKRALELNAKALNIWDKVKDKDIEEFISACQNSVYYHVEYGDLKEAKKINKLLSQTYLNEYKEKKIKETDEHRASRRNYILGNVRIYAALNETELAERFIDSLKKEELSNPAKGDKEGINYLLGAYQATTYQYYDTYRFRECIKHTNEALVLARKHDFPFYIMAFEAQLATSYEKLEEYTSGLIHIQKAKSAFEFKGFSSSKISLQMIEAMCYDGMKNTDQAKKITEAALREIILEKAGRDIPLKEVNIHDVKNLNSYNFINIFTTGARIYWFSYQKTGNKSDLKIAENLFVLSAHMFQNYYLKEEFNSYINYLHLKIAEGLLSVGALTGDPEKLKHMVNLIEGNASQHLLKEFEKKLKVFNPERKERISRLAGYNAEIEFYTEKSNEAKDKGKFDNRLLDLQQSKQALLQEIEEREKNYTAFNSSSFEIDKVLDLMKGDQQILKYYVADRYTFLLSLTKDKIAVYRLAENESLKKRVIDYVQDVKMIKPEYSGKATSLFDILLKHQTKTKITVIPDNFLNYVPFEALYNAGQNVFSGQKSIISYDYSLPLWLLRQQKKPINFKYNLAVFSPAYTPDFGEKSRGNFKNLKYAKKEAEAISTLYKGNIYLDRAATKEKFLKSLEQYKIFHLSMHSVLFEEDFNESCLVFSDDQRLYFSELYGMQIPSEMVVLSACETGAGKLVDGEGVMSLARSLSYAGVQSAVVSLWPVPDKETSEIMISFYENLKKGMAKDAALAKAKTTFITNNPIKKHPYYWAGFIINGNVTPVSDKTNWYFYIVFGLLLITVLWRLRRRLFQFRK